MKRSLALAAIALSISMGAFSQTQSISGFKDAFTGFAGDLAGSLALNSAIGSNWSDAYIGNFPHFGVGVTTGAAFVSVDSAKTIFDAMGGAALPDALKNIGVPIPAAGATLKIGIPFLPMDVGIKGGYIPSSVGEKLKSLTKVGLDYQNIGIQLRYALVKQNLLLPNVSLGASYNYQQGSITAPTGITAQHLDVPSALGAYWVNVSSPDLNLGWKSNTFDFTAQVSKLLLFVVPYAGLGYSIGTSSVTGGLNADVTTNYSSLAQLKSDLGAFGIAPDQLDAKGFSYTTKATDPVFRLYGGFSLRIIVLDIDTQVMYVPAAKALGASLTARVQL